MPPKKDTSVAVALISAAAVVISALIGYFATHKIDRSLVAYTGRVKDATSLKPVGNASVAITEDQKVPLRFTTDSEGVFFAQLSKDSQAMLLEVKAAGYQDYSRRGSTVRTGSEDILLQPLPQPPSPTLAQQEDLSKPASTEKSPAEMAENSYGYVTGDDLINKKIDKLSVVDGRVGGGLFEIRKSDGLIYLVGFVDSETMDRSSRGLHQGEPITFYSLSWRGAHNEVFMPLSSVACSKWRSSQFADALECTIR